MATATLDQPVIEGASAATEPVRDRSTGGSVPRRRRATALTCAVVVLLGVDVVLVAPYLGTAVASLLQAVPGWAGLAGLSTAGSLTAFALVRRRLLRAAGVRVSTASSLASILVSNAFHVTLPGGVAFSTGYSYRWMREHGAAPTVAGSSLAINGLLSSACLIGLGLGASLLVGGASWAGLLLHLVGVAALMLGARHAVRHPERTLAAAGSLLAVVNRLLRRPATTGIDRLADTVTQLRSVRPTARDWTAATGFALLNWVLDLACLALCARATGLPGLTLGALAAAYVAGMAASSLSLLPGGLGVVDAALVLGLVAGGSPAAALPAVLLYRLISLLAVVVAGWVVHAATLLRQRAGAPFTCMPEGRFVAAALRTTTSRRRVPWALAVVGVGASPAAPRRGGAGEQDVAGDGRASLRGRRRGRAPRRTGGGRVRPYRGRARRSRARAGPQVAARRPERRPGRLSGSPAGSARCRAVRGVPAAARGGAR